MTDTAETMVERVALAVGSRLYGYVDPVDTPYLWPIAASAARAAIAAMAEPTPAMIAAFKAERLKAVIEEVGPEYPGLHFIDDKGAEEVLREALKVAVQAALTEQPE